MAAFGSGEQRLGVDRSTTYACFMQESKALAECSVCRLGLFPLTSPDPVAKRLRYLFADARTRRRAIERELARRHQEAYGRRSDDRPGCVAEPTVAHGDTSPAAQRAPAVVA